MGSVLGHFICGDILKILFGLFILFVSVRMIFAGQSKVTGVEKLSGVKSTSVLSFVMGAKSGVLGIGCGSMSIALLSCWNIPIRNIIAISAACSLTVAVVGAVSYMLIGSCVANLPAYSIGYIYWPAFFWVTIATLVFAQVGVTLSHKLPVQNLKKILGVVLLLIALHMLF